ncbi:MAG: cytochrome c oxidase subunit 3 [Tepidisphaeraceae bacterium]
MSESVLDHGYLPEEHAPDPVIGHGDPTPPGKIAIWLFLASEIMFFIGLLGTYIVLRSGSPHLFSNHAAALSKPLAGTNTLVLILSSVTMYIAVDAAHKGARGKALWALFATFLCACGFMGIKTIEYTNKFTHHTIVGADSPNGPFMVYDGHVHEEHGKRVLHGYRASLVPDFNIHLISESNVEELSGQKEAQSFDLPKHISQDITYGPWKNVFYASYFTTTGVHGVHVLGGMVALGILLVQALRGRIMGPTTEYVGLYWHFVDLVWIFLFPLLYLI